MTFKANSALHAAVCAAALLLLTPAWAATHCCGVVSIDTRSGVVTAQDKATQRRFEFKVENAILLRRIQPGQAVTADFAAGKATVEGIAGQYHIVAAAAGGAPAQPAPVAAAPGVAPVQPAVPTAPRAPAGVIGAAPPPAPQAPTAGVIGATPSPAQPLTRPPAPLPAQPPRAADAIGAAPGATPRTPTPAPSMGSVAGPAAGDDPDAQDDDEPVQKASARPLPRPGPVLRSGAKPTRLNEYPDAQKLLDEVAKGIAAKEIDVALLGGEKYKINNCLGIKASAGEFRVKLASPNARIEGSGARLTFRVDRVSLSALKIRMRPNAGNPLKLCHWSKKFEVGGAATDIRYELRFDPVLDLLQCKLGSVGIVKHRLDIGGLNLKPLQNDLDRMGKDMFEDAFNNAVNFNMGDRIVAATNAALGVQCVK